jgi:hypothetical protein
MSPENPADYFALDISKLQLTQMNGYLYFYKPDHLLAGGNGMVSLHRHIMSVQLNRWLKPHEIVVFINGNRQDTRSDNLKVISRAELMKLNVNAPPKIELICLRCGNVFMETSAHAIRRRYCSNKCAIDSKQKFDPSPEELEQYVWGMPTTHVAEIYGVSDKAIEKRCKKLGINKPPRGYWAKLHAGQIDPTLNQELADIEQL